MNLLQEFGPKARVLAGGTELLPRMKYRLETPELVISLKGIPVQKPFLTSDDGLVVDALTTLTAATRSEEVLNRVPLLADAAAAVASYEIRNMGTLGGNLCQETRCLYYNQRHDVQFVEPCYKRGGELCYFAPKGKKCMAVYMADTALAFLCLEAELEIRGAHGTRLLPIEELYSGDARDPLKIGHDEIITRIIIPSEEGRHGWAYKKFSLRGGLEFGAVTVAVLVHVASDGITCEEARIAAGAVFAAPLRARKAESILWGREISKGLMREAANIAAEETRVVAHHGFSTPYLREILRVQAMRALQEAFAKC